MDIASNPLLAPQPRKREGRPPGATNYSGSSIVAHTMKQEGLDWRKELVVVYNDFKRDPSEANKMKMLYWLELMPYIALKMVDKETRRQRVPRRRKPKVSQYALERLVEAEGRRQ